MAKRQIFERKAPEQDYLAKLEELLKKNKGSGLYEGFDVNPRAFRIGGKVVDPSGLGQDQMKDEVKFAPYDYSTIPFSAPRLGNVGQYNFPEQEIVQEQPTQEEQPNYNTPQGFQQVLREMTAIPVSTTADGGILLSNGFIEYQDGTRREATYRDVPRVVRQFNDGSVLLENGQFINASDRVGRAYRGLGGLMDILFGQQQAVTQEYGNINPIEPTVGNVNLGTDIRTKDLPQNFYFTLPFNAEVVEITQDDGTRFGDQSGHQGYGNSVLLRLPNGSMIRMAHLSDMENFSVGDIVGAFDYIGTPGQSGNTYGEHLDLEYYTPEGQISDPESFFINSMDYVDTDAIMQSREDKSTLTPEEKQWAEAQQNLLKQGVQMSLDPNSLRPQAPEQAQEQAQEYRPFQTIREAGQEVAQNVGEAVQPMSPQRQALAQVPEQLAQKAGLQAELGLSEGIVGQDPMQARISALSQQPKVPAQERDLFGKVRQLAGNVTERVGDVLGIPEGVASETIAGGATKRTNQALASEIGGEKPEAVPGIRQNIKDIGQDLVGKASQAINPIVSRAGEGIDILKQKASNLFQKISPMSLFQGQKQVGYETPGKTMIETAGQKGGTPTPDAFFKYGGADQYAKYLIANADQAKGGALDTSLFTPEFFQDPNRVANVFGETSQGKEATGKYKEYLGSQIKEGFNEPYRTERKQEGDYIVEYKIPIQEYFQNQYYKNLLSETPDTLKSGFSFDQFQLPTVSRTVSEFKGEAPTQTGREPIFKSGMVDLFRKAGSTMGKLAGDVFKTPAAVYQPSQQSQKFAVPEALSRVFSAPSTANLSIPTTTKTVVERIQPKVQPTLQDYLRMGKTEAQYYAETGQQSTLDEMNKARAFTAPIQETIQRANQIALSAPNVSPQLREIQQREKAQGGVQLPSGAVATVAPATQSNTSQSSAQLSSPDNKSVFSSAGDWLKRLFKRT